MPRQPLRLDRPTLAALRPGALVAVHMGAAIQLPRRRPRGYALVPRSRAHQAGPRYAAAPRAGTLRAQLPGLRAEAPPPRSQVAVVEVRNILEQRASAYFCGETCGYDELTERFTAAALDPAVGGIVVDADSPGGDDPGLEQGIARMARVLASAGKIALGYVNEYAASAACWLLAGVCSGIYLPRSGRIGSIAQVVPYVGDLPDELTEVYIARGLPGKMVPSGMEPLDELGKKRLDELAASGTERFITSMAALRGIPAATIRAWNGEMFTGEAAIAAGLADGIGSLEDTIALAGQLAAQGVAA